MAMDEKGLGQRLQLARKSAGLTQQELCHKASLSYSTLAKIERGAIKSPSIFTIQNIAAALGVGLDDLIGNGAIPTAKPEAKMVAQNGVRFVYFDINGCLVRFFHAAFTQLAADTGTRADEVENTFWHYNDVVCRGDMTMDDFNTAFAEKLGVPKLNWIEYYLAAVEPIKDMHELVKWAAERYHVGLVTNIMPGFITAMQARQLLPDVTFDSIIDSSQVGAIKPERAIYEAASQKAGVEPREIMLIDDDRANLMAAERLGWHVLWFDDYRSAESVKRIHEALVPAE
jgi:FMN phosphatase YigB (HAD superfamily)/DNA-binding XRE family transcriptional regulator